MRIVYLILVSALAVSFTGCGSGGGNDQGTSFTLFGFFAKEEDGNEYQGVSGYFLPLSEYVDNEPSQTELISWVGVKNNLSGQLIRTQRAYMSFLVVGGGLQPPSTSVPMSVVMSPGENSGMTTLPDNIAGFEGEDGGALGNIAYIGFGLVPSQIRAWLNLNRGALPEPPFDMEVTVYVRGITSSGNVMDTNPASIIVTVMPDVVVQPLPPAGEATVEESAAGLEEML